MCWFFRVGAVLFRMRGGIGKTLVFYLSLDAIGNATIGSKLSDGSVPYFLSTYNKKFFIRNCFILNR